MASVPGVLRRPISLRARSREGFMGVLFCPMGMERWEWEACSLRESS